MNFRNISRLLAIFAVMLFVATPLLTAQDSDDDAVAAAFQKIVKLGPGVHFVKTNEEGEIVSLVVVGSKTITTVFGAPRGQQIARRGAGLAAKAEFSKFLKEKVTVVESDATETIVMSVGKEGPDREKLEVTGKEISTSSAKYTLFSEGILRGMTVLHVNVDSDLKVTTVVLGWDAETTEKTKKIKKLLDSDLPAEEKKAAAGKKKPAPLKINKKIEGGSATSSNAKKFIP